MSITTIKFTLRCRGGALPWFTGSETRAAFLNLISTFDRDLAADLHGRPGSRAPWSLKALRVVRGGEVVCPDGRSTSVERASPPYVDCRVLVREDAVAQFSVSMFDDEYARRIMLNYPNIMNARINVKGVEMEVVGLDGAVKSLDKVLGDAPKEYGEVDLHFLSPTYLNPLRGPREYKLLYPDVEAMLVSMATLAHSISGRDFHRVIDNAASILYVSGIEVRSPPRREAGEAAHAPTGFLGWVKLRPMRGADRGLVRDAAALLVLAEYTNVGGNRTAGYGEVRVRFAGRS